MCVCMCVSSCVCERECVCVCAVSNVPLVRDGRMGTVKPQKEMTNNEIEKFVMRL